MAVRLDEKRVAMLVFQMVVMSDAETVVRRATMMVVQMAAWMADRLDEWKVGLREPLMADS